MANTMDKLREIAGSIRNFADVAEHCDITRICNTIPAMRVLADELDAILRESEAQGDAGAVEEWLDRDWPLWRNDPDHPTVQRIRRAWDAAQASQAALAASATPRTEPAEGREACPRDCGCVVHCRREQVRAITTPTAGDGKPVAFRAINRNGSKGAWHDASEDAETLQKWINTGWQIEYAYAAPPAGSARLNDPELQAQLEDSVERHRRVVDALTGDGARVTEEEWQATDAEILEWVERHGLGGMSVTDARCAFEDARTAHLAAREHTNGN